MPSSTTLATYAPPPAEVPNWDEIREFTIAGVQCCEGAIAYAPLRLVGIAAPYVGWCHARGIELDNETVFVPARVDEYITAGVAHLADRSRAAYRSALLRMSEELVGWFPHFKATPIAGSAPKHALSSAEIIEVRRWANGRTRPGQVRDVLALLALTLGAGLDSSELRIATVGDVERTNAGVLAHVRGPRARVVPVRTEWASTLLATTVGRDAEEFILRPRRVKNGGGENLIGEIVRTSPHDASVGRLRSMWIQSRIAEGADPAALVAEAGLGRLYDLQRYSALI